MVFQSLMATTAADAAATAACHYFCSCRSHSNTPASSNNYNHKQEPAVPLLPVIMILGNKKINNAALRELIVFCVMLDELLLLSFVSVRLLK
jgi:hypothetical protein